jgi:hemerythrin-like domain-containing protein
MQPQTEPLLDKHRRFSYSLETIRQSAERVEDLSLPELRKAIDAANAFLVQQFLPHARTEEEEVYPLVNQALGGSATKGLVRDHTEVRQLVLKLTALRERLVYSYFGPSQVRLLRGVLYDISGLIAYHLAKEDELYVSIAAPVTVDKESALVGATWPPGTGSASPMCEPARN